MGNIFSKRWLELDYEKVLADFDERIQSLVLSIEERSRRYRRIRGLLLVSFGLSYSLLWAIFIFDYRVYLLRGGVSLLAPIILSVRWIRYKTINWIWKDTVAYISDASSLTWSVRLLWFTLIILYPLLLFMAYKGISYYYEKMIEHEASSLRLLKSKQKLKLEELKKQTRYYMMRELVERYEENDLLNVEDSFEKYNSGLRQRSPGLDAKNKKSSARPSIDGNFISTTPNSVLLKEDTNGLSTPSPESRFREFVPLSPSLNGDLDSVMASSGTPSSSSQDVSSRSHPSLPLQPIPPSHSTRSWMDRIVDIVLGEENSSITKGVVSGALSSESEKSFSSLPVFALICSRCGGHNGLVPERDYFSLRYVCPKCGLWNQAKMSFESQIDPSGHEVDKIDQNEAGHKAESEKMDFLEDSKSLNMSMKENTVLDNTSDKMKSGKKKKGNRIPSTSL